MTIKADIEGLDQLRRKLDRDQYRSAVEAALLAGAESVRAYLAEYPASPGGRPQFPKGPNGRAVFASRRQRGFVMAAIRTGAISIPYKRGQDRKSQKLGQSWTARALAWDRVKLGSRADYSRIVHDESYNNYSDYHKATGWRTIQQYETEQAGELDKAINGPIARWLEDN